MRRAELEHAIRAATEIVAEDRVIVIGSQAILGSYTEDELPDEATMSIEVDIAPMHDDDAGALASGHRFTKLTASTYKASAGKPRCCRSGGRTDSSQCRDQEPTAEPDSAWTRMTYALPSSRLRARKTFDSSERYSAPSW